MAKARKKTKAPRDTRVPPTAEQQSHGNYTRSGEAHRRIPMIDTLYETSKITDDEFRRLTHYRDQNAACDRSLTKSCLDIREGGGGQGGMTLSTAALSAHMEVGRIERELGISLRGIARSIAIDDWSLSRWCCERYGSRERYDGKGKFVAIVPLREKASLAMALMELRMAARRILA